MKIDTDPLYLVHDMVALYLDSRTNDSIQILLNASTTEKAAFICPWLLIFGKERINFFAENRIVSILGAFEENHVIITLKSTIQALMTSESISELEESRANFSSLLGPRIADLISTESQSLIAVSAQAITTVFSKRLLQLFSIP